MRRAALHAKIVSVSLSVSVFVSVSELVPIEARTMRTARGRTAVRDCFATHFKRMQCKLLSSSPSSSSSSRSTRADLRDRPNYCNKASQTMLRTHSQTACACAVCVCVCVWGRADTTTVHYSTVQYSTAHSTVHCASHNGACQSSDSRSDTIWQLLNTPTPCACVVAQNRNFRLREAKRGASHYSRVVNSLCDSAKLRPASTS